jgi:hypothetical protein
MYTQVHIDTHTHPSEEFTGAPHSEIDRRVLLQQLGQASDVFPKIFTLCPLPPINTPLA